MTVTARSQSAYNAPPAKLSALPTIRVTDPQMARFVDALRNWVDARSGARDPYERAVTMRDLVQLGMIDQATVTRRSLAPTGAAMPPSVLVQTPSGVLPMTTEAFAKSIYDSALFRDLRARLDDPTRFDRLPGEIKAILLRDIADEAAARGADIRRVESTLQNATQSLAVKVEETTAALEGSMAGVRETTFAVATESRATAGQVTQVQARLDDFNGGTATVEESMTAVADRSTGLEAQYTLKVSAGNAIAGFGLAATQNTDGYATSAVIVMADKFAIVGTGDTIADPLNPPIDRIPFGVDTINDTIYINGQVRINTGTGMALEDLGASDLLQLTASGIAFIFKDVNATTATSPASITFAANLQNVTGAVAFSGTAYNAAGTVVGTVGGVTFTSVTDTTAVLTKANFVAPGAGVKYVVVTATLGALSDVMTIHRGDDGSSAITVILSNEAHTLPSANDGSGVTYTGSGTAIHVFEGTTELAYDGIGTDPSTWTIASKTATTGTVTPGGTSDTGNSATIAAHSGMSTDLAVITYAITGKSSTGAAFSVSRTQSLAKSKTGLAGAAGDTGATGPPGDRGSLTGYGSLYGIYYTTSWADNSTGASTQAANRVIYNLLTGETSTAGVATTTHLRIGDTVTLTNSGVTNAITKYWSGTGWVAPGVVIDGNLLVSGTVSGSAIVANSITSLGTVTSGTLNTSGYLKADGSTALAIDPLGIGSTASTAVSGNMAGSADIGVFGKSAASAGAGVYGWNSHSAGIGVRGYGETGVSGVSRVSSGVGVYGGGYNLGISTGVYGITNNSVSGSVGVHGIGNAAGQIGVKASSSSGTALRVEGATYFDSPLNVVVADGTAPIVIYSTSLVTNLNADRLDGQHGSYYAAASSIPTVNNATLTLAVSGIGLSGSASFTANSSSAATFTVASNATSGNTASALVARDGSGGFQCGTVSLQGTTYINNFRMSGMTTGAGSATASFAGTDKPGSNSANSWLTVNINGTTCYIPIWT